MFKKKSDQVIILVGTSDYPTRQEMKAIITQLNNNPDFKKISAAVEILREFATSSSRSANSAPSIPHFKSALLIASKAVRKSDEECNKVNQTSDRDSEQKKKTLKDTEVILNIGKAIACV